MKVKKKKPSPLWNILIAEDDLKNRAELLKTLSKTAICTIVGNGDDAIKAYQQAVRKNKLFDFILLDVSMPGTDGFQVLKAIRNDEDTRSSSSFKPARIVMITSFKDSLMENYNMGWDEYITKPVDTAILLDKMRQMSA